jgi:hypothetical protein
VGWLGRDPLRSAERRRFDFAGNIEQHLLLLVPCKAGQRPGNIVRCLKAVELDRVDCRPSLPEIKSEGIDGASLRGVAFRRNAELDANGIKVETNGSEVILKVSVRSWIEREEAERVAWMTPGVTAVHDRIIVSP